MHITRNAVACALVLALGAPGLPSGGVHAQSLPAALSKLHSGVDTVRMAGFYEIFRTANAGFATAGSLRPGAERLAKYARANASVAPALIDLLERENVAVRSGAGRDLGEA